MVGARHRFVLEPSSRHLLKPRAAQLVRSRGVVDRQRLCFLVSRLEERESEMKKEYNALHQRHTEVGPALT